MRSSSTAYYQPDNAGANAEFNNIESIQVLKGPQGMLYGRETPGYYDLLDAQGNKIDDDIAKISNFTGRAKLEVDVTSNLLATVGYNHVEFLDNRGNMYTPEENISPSVPPHVLVGHDGPGCVRLHTKACGRSLPRIHTDEGKRLGHDAQAAGVHGVGVRCLSVSGRSPECRRSLISCRFPLVDEA